MILAELLLSPHDSGLSPLNDNHVGISNYSEPSWADIDRKLVGHRSRNAGQTAHPGSQ